MPIGLEVVPDHQAAGCDEPQCGPSVRHPVRVLMSAVDQDEVVPACVVPGVEGQRVGEQLGDARRRR